LPQSFNDIVFRCVDEALAEAMGFAVRDAIYFKEGRRTQDLSIHLGNLVAILEKNFGQGVTRTLTMVIARRVYSELCIDFAARPGYSLPDYVEAAKSIASKLSRSES